MIAPHPHELSGDERDYVIDVVSRRFGIDPRVFDSYRFERTGKKYVTIAVADHRPPEGLSIASTGMPFLRVNLPHPKLTTAAAMLFGSHATRNVLSFSSDRARAYVRRVDLQQSDWPAEIALEPGYVLVRWGEVTLGLGLLLPTPAGLRLKSLYPGRWSP